jgi:putative ABC transport system ATP-binding protein
VNATAAPSVVIAMSGVSRVYPGPPPVHALRPTDLTVRRGDYLTVVGPSGSGKTTLLNVVGLLDRPSGGSYALDGIGTAGLTEAERTALRGRRIGFVFQDFHLLPHRTATENVALGLLYTDPDRRRRRATARETLARVGLGSRLDALPITMSGGERQRVAIARALVNTPSLLLCDEPTGNLDSVTAGRVLDLLDQLNADGVTVIVITHDAATAGRSRRSITIRDGMVAGENASAGSLGPGPDPAGAQPRGSEPGSG